MAAATACETSDDCIFAVPSPCGARRYPDRVQPAYGTDLDAIGAPEQLRRRRRRLMSDAKTEDPELTPPQSVRPEPRRSGLDVGERRLEQRGEPTSA